MWLVAIGYYDLKKKLANTVKITIKCCYVVSYAKNRLVRGYEYEKNT